MRMRRPALLLSLFLFWAMLSGMGQAPGTEVPIPEINFQAIVIDDQDISTKTSNASWDGDIFFSGMRGKGVVTISFEKVRKVTNMGTGTNSKTDFQITLKTGEVVAVSFDNDSKFQGATEFGTYRIEARNIKEVRFE